MMRVLGRDPPCARPLAGALAIFNFSPLQTGPLSQVLPKRLKAPVFSTEVARFGLFSRAPRIACRGCYEGVWRAKRRFCAQLRDAVPFRRRDLCPRDLGEDRHKLARAVVHGKRGERHAC
jgi:hypothetical protein